MILLHLCSRHPPSPFQLLASGLFLFTGLLVIHTSSSIPSDQYYGGTSDRFQAVRDGNEGVDGRRRKRRVAVIDGQNREHRKPQIRMAHQVCQFSSSSSALSLPRHFARLSLLSRRVGSYFTAWSVEWGHPRPHVVDLVAAACFRFPEVSRGTDHKSKRAKSSINFNERQNRNSKRERRGSKTTRGTIQHRQRRDGNRRR